MKEYRLRNHIPIGGPATREPYVGDEPYLRISLGFTPDWYHRRLGIDFSQKWHTDPLVRYEALLKMKKHLNKTFPMVPYFKLNEKNSIEQTCATISAAYGITVIPQCYGMKPVWYKNEWPDIDPSSRLSKEEIARLEPFEVENLPFVEGILRQMDIIEKEFGVIHGYLNYQGIMNVAMKIYGNDFFIDMSVDEQFSDHLFSHIADTIMKVSKLVQKRQRDSGFDVDLLSMSNCVMNMVSPQMYERFVLPLDRMLSKQYQRFGIHTCNWNVTPYLESLAKIEKMGYLDMGTVSDMKKARRIFPDTRRAVLISPMLMIEKSTNEIMEVVARINEDLAPCDIVLADVDPNTPDKKIIDFWNAVEMMNQQHE